MWLLYTIHSSYTYLFRCACFPIHPYDIMISFDNWGESAPDTVFENFISQLHYQSLILPNLPLIWMHEVYANMNDQDEVSIPKLEDILLHAALYVTLSLLPTNIALFSCIELKYFPKKSNYCIAVKSKLHTNAWAVEVCTFFFPLWISNKFKKKKEKETFCLNIVLNIPFCQVTFNKLLNFASCMTDNWKILSTALTLSLSFSCQGYAIHKCWILVVKTLWSQPDGPRKRTEI